MVDQLVGAKLRSLRVARGLSQDAFGRLLGFSATQLDKYETGTNRIAAATLYDIAVKLNVQVSWFFIHTATSNQAGTIDNEHKLAATSVDENKPHFVAASEFDATAEPRGAEQNTISMSDPSKAR